MAWIECVPNISEGRRDDVINAVANAVVAIPGAQLRSLHRDVDHNRSVLTIVGPAPSVTEAAFRCVAAAAEHIDIREHEGVHPRFGATDVLPLIPLGRTKLKSCGGWARKLAARIESELEIPSYLYGAASEKGESLPEVRARAEKNHPERAHPSAGAIAVGARQILVAFNVMLNTQDVAIASAIANQIREKDGGLAAVRALGFSLESRECVQVSMNLLDYKKTSPLRAYRRVRQLAREAGVEVTGSEVVGMLPRDAITRGFRAATRCSSIDVLDPEPDFLDRVAARSATPAGGSAAAYAGALGAALVVMSCDCSRPTPRLRELRMKAERLRAELTTLVEADSAAVREMMRDGGEDALKAATETPTRVMEAAAALWSIAAAAAHHCDEKVFTDCTSGRRLAEAARDMAAEITRANLPLITDGTFRSKIARRLAAAFSG